MARKRRNKKSPDLLNPDNLSNSVVLLSNMNRSTCGTGFVVAVRPPVAYVCTCDHVVEDLGGPEQVWAGNRRARVEFSGKAFGVDLALLQLHDLPGARALPPGGAVEPETGMAFSLWGYSQLHSNSDKYLGRQVTGRLGAAVVMQTQTADGPVLAWELNVDSKSPPLVGGYSGAPILINGDTVVAIASHQFDDRRGLAIAASALQPKGMEPLWRLPEGAPETELDQTVEWPEPPEEGPNPDDPQKGRWGGTSEAAGLKLSAVLTEVGEEEFYVDLVISATDGRPVGGPARFHLHPTYPRSTITIRRVRPNNTLVLEELSAYEIYTVGAEVQRPGLAKPIYLEFDLDDLPGLPSRFR